MSVRQEWNESYWPGWRPGDGVWYILKSTAGYRGFNSFTTAWGSGAAGDRPVIGDGDQIADLGVRRATTGVWHVQQMKEFIPASMRPVVRRTYNVVLDQIDLLTGRRDSLTPPRNQMFVGGEFKAVGQEFLRHFVEVGGLRPEDRVLDIGSGIGRMAVPLTRYLSPDGQYRGIEIVEDGVRWCQNRITSRFPNFQFLRADVYNKMYHPTGRHKAAEYRFPFEHDSFDFVFLTSVFTHMFPADVTNYVSEVSRVLRPGGRCFATFFLATPESRALIEQGKSTQPFQHEGEGYLSVSGDTPERAIAFEENFVRYLHQAHRLRILEPVRYGSWCGRNTYTSYQDIVLSEKA